MVSMVFQEFFINVNIFAGLQGLQGLPIFKKYKGTASVLAKHFNFNSAQLIVSDWRYNLEDVTLGNFNFGGVWIPGPQGPQGPQAI